MQVLLEAFAQVADELPTARLALVGDGDDVPSLREQATSLSIADRIDWHGPLSGHELVSAYQQASVVVLPSLTESESFGMTLIEAMSCGRPVIGSRIGGIPHVIREGVDGLLVPPGDPGALADALGTVLTDHARRESMGAAGREAAESVWDWEHSTHATLQQLRVLGP